MEINENLCILAGAHAADGNLSRKGVFLIGDENKNNIEIIANLIKKEFKFFPKIKQKNNENVYLIAFRNKIFYTFLKENFNFPLGPKTYTVEMPKIIKGNYMWEKSFVAGAMTFESSVNMNKSIVFSVTSKKFRDDIASILNKNRINIKISEQIKLGNRKKQYILRTSEILTSRELEKWLDYYIEGSEKWFKVLEFSNGFFGKIKNINNAKMAFKSTYSKGRNIQIYNLIDIIKNLKQTDINYLYKKLNIGKTTIMKYLTILNDCKIIGRKKIISKLDLNNLSSNTHITLNDHFRGDMFNKINKYEGHDARICRLLNVKDYVYCKWRNGERGIPLDKLKILSELGRFSKKICLNIKSVDREIIEFNRKIIEWRVPWRPWLKDIKLDIYNKGVKKWITKD